MVKSYIRKKSITIIYIGVAIILKIEKIWEK